MLCQRLTLLTTCFLFTGFFACEHKKPKPSLEMLYENRHKSVLIQDAGPPDSVSSDGSDGQVLTYVTRWKGRGRATSDGDTTVYSPPQDYECKQMFFCNKNGVIYKILEKGC